MQKVAFFRNMEKKDTGKRAVRFFCSLLALFLVVGVSACSTEEDESTLQNDPGFGELRVSEIDGMEQVYVPAGKFFMGENISYSEASSRKNEAPQHQVELPGFWIDKTEVTGAMYALFLSDTQPTDETLDEYLGRSSCYEYSSYHKTWEVDDYCENRPVYDVTWYGAAAYCEWAGRRLPSEAEWEKAARGENADTYPWGNAEPSCNLAQFTDCKSYSIAAGSLPLGASIYGALDMSGNVWEWVSDKYSDNYIFRDSPTDDLQGPQLASETRVIRGGSSNSEAFLIRAVVRDGMEPEESDGDLGFRCASSE